MLGCVGCEGGGVCLDCFDTFWVGGSHGFGLVEWSVERRKGDIYTVCGSWRS
jgi:hypothetical protein